MRLELQAIRFPARHRDIKLLGVVISRNAQEYLVVTRFKPEIPLKDILHSHVFFR